MREKTLVILAAGMGSRFGGLKQIEPVGPNGEFIIDYSIYSAVRYGFNKIVFVIKEENYELFKETVGSRIEGKVKVEYAFQKLEDIPEGFSVPEGRIKPWGTAHALYAARHLVHDNFGLITADDFYGDETFKQVADYLDTSDTYGIVGYRVGETLSENGAVKRAVLTIQGDHIERVVESKVEREQDQVKCVPLDSKIDPFYVDLDRRVSMMFFGFTTAIFDKIGSIMEDSFRNNQDHLNDFELLIPDVLDMEISDGKIVDYIGTEAKWMGVTYKEDVEKLKNHIDKEINNGVYPRNLWN